MSTPDLVHKCARLHRSQQETPQSPSEGEWTPRLRSVHPAQYRSVSARGEARPLTTAWMSLENMTRSESRRTQEDTYRMSPLWENPQRQKVASWLPETGETEG